MISELGNKSFLTMINYWSWWWEVTNERDELARAILTVSIVILATFWYKRTFSESRNGRPPLPPGPRGLPVVGYLPFLNPNLNEAFTEIASCYGPIFKLKLGSKLYVVVNSSDLAKAVTHDQDQIFANRGNALLAGLTITYGTDGVNDIAWSNNNTHWLRTRKLLVNNVLSKSNVEACHGFLRHAVRKTVKDVYARLGTGIDISKISYMTQYNVITSMLWGQSTNSCNIGTEFRDVQLKIVELLGASNISDFFPMLSRFDLQGVVRKMKRQWEEVDRIFNGVIEEKLKSSSKIQMEDAAGKDERKDFVQILLELKEQKDTLNLTIIKALMMDMLIAGTDTTTTMSEWVMAEILSNPGVMKKVQDELTEVVGVDNSVEESHLPKLLYLDAVIKETFRLHPTLPLLIQRSPSETCTVGGYTIPKDTTVLLNVWAIHRDPENWDNPLEFKPKRFLNTDGTNKWDYSGNNLKFFPFGAGRRICPGSHLAEQMLMYLLASLLHSFNWCLPKDEELDLSDQFGFVLKKRKPVIAIPSQRLPVAKLY